MRKGSKEAKARMKKVRSYIGKPKRKKTKKTVSFKAKGKPVKFKARTY